MNNDIILSICIATYNRAGYIGETLDSIIPQLDDDVELLVVDGASTDDTEKTARQFVERNSRIRYVRLSAKGGVDQDYNKAVELARGEFCWLFTDDDILRPGAVATVKTAIRAGHGLVIVNSEVRDRELSNILQRQRMNIRYNKVYSPNEMACLFIDALSYISFIGGVVIRRSLWMGRDRESYFGTEFVHVGVIFQKPLMETTLVIAEPYISIRYGNAQWTLRRFDISVFKWPKLVWSFKHISEQAKRSVIPQEPWRGLRTLIAERGRGAYTIQHYHERFSALPLARLWKMGAWLIARLPVKVVASILYYYYHLARPNELLQAYDFRPHG